MKLTIFFFKINRFSNIQKLQSSEDDFIHESWAAFGLNGKIVIWVGLGGGHKSVDADMSRYRWATFTPTKPNLPTSRPAVGLLRSHVCTGSRWIYSSSRLLWLSSRQREREPAGGNCDGGGGGASSWQPSPPYASFLAFHCLLHSVLAPNSLSISLISHLPKTLESSKP